MNNGNIKAMCYFSRVIASPQITRHKLIWHVIVGYLCFKSVQIHSFVGSKTQILLQIGASQVVLNCPENIRKEA